MLHSTRHLLFSRSWKLQEVGRRFQYSWNIWPGKYRNRRFGLFEWSWRVWQDGRHFIKWIMINETVGVPTRSWCACQSRRLRPLPLHDSVLCNISRTQTRLYSWVLKKVGEYPVAYDPTLKYQTERFQMTKAYCSMIENEMCKLHWSSVGLTKNENFYQFIIYTS